MNETSPSIRVESRWLAGAAVVAVVVLVEILPGRISLYPAWVPYALGVAMIVPMVGAVLTAGKGLWEALERITTMLFFVTVVGGALALLLTLVQAMIHRASDVSGLELLASSIGVWVTNVLAFSLLYWQLDRGGPGARENLQKVKPDWQFPQTGCPDDVPAGWQPTFVDYLFLGYSTATAFSPTDALPLTSRAKLLMMLESTISLVTIVVVASRAINILGG
ncbi:MAG: hypothetical protein GX456_01435 [Verrucomicrobia bacterium]|nr:hypothetical protein [Verrucomicrobiota bacterium]